MAKQSKELADELCRLDDAVIEMYNALAENGMANRLTTELVQARLEVLMREVASLHLRINRLNGHSE